MKDLSDLSSRLSAQEKHSKNKLYGLHEPHVERISKGKAHKRYEFGCKVGIVSGGRANRALGVKAFHGAPYDGHTLSTSMVQAKKITDKDIKENYVDLGHRGHKQFKKLTRTAKKRFGRRSAIERL